MQSTPLKKAKQDTAELSAPASLLPSDEKELQQALQELNTDAKDEDVEVDVEAKWMGKSFPMRVPITTTFGALKAVLAEQTQVLPQRQKIVGLKRRDGAPGLPPDNMRLSDVKATPKNPMKYKMIMVGPQEKDLFVDLADDERPEVEDDLDYEYDPTEHEVEKDPVHIKEMEQCFSRLKVNLISQPRPGKKLLVLDLDYTMFDMKSKAENFDQLKRPFTDQMLTAAYPHYDIVIWSQTSWKWLEIKLTELGLLTNTGYQILFVLDRSCMFSVQSRDRKGQLRKHQVKALPLIWKMFPQYSAKNTIMVDDLGRNFAMNPQSGLKIKAYKQAHINRSRDTELLLLTQYLLLIKELDDFTQLKHGLWKEYITENASKLIKKSS